MTLKKGYMKINQCFNFRYTAPNANHYVGLRDNVLTRKWYLIAHIEVVLVSHVNGHYLHATNQPRLYNNI